MVILIPALNAAPYIKRALASVCNQTRDDWDVQLLIDCATYDNTWKKVKQFLSTVKRRRSIHVNISAKPGLPNVYKELIDRAEPKDDICGFLDADDRLLPQAVKRVLACYESKPTLGHVWTQFIQHPQGASGWSRALPKGKTIKQAFLSSWWGAQHWRTFSKPVYESSPYSIQTDVPYATDYNLALVLAATNCDCYFLRQGLYEYNTMVSGITQTKQAKQKANFREMLRRFIQWDRNLAKQCVS